MISLRTFLLLAGAVTMCRAECQPLLLKDKLLSTIKAKFVLTSNIPLSQTELGNGCKDPAGFRNELLDITKECMPGAVRPMVSKSYDTFMDMICAAGDYQSKYLTNSQCFNDEFPKALDCAGGVIDALKANMVNFEFVKICCPIKDFMACVKTWAGKCSAGAAAWVETSFTKLVPKMFNLMCRSGKCK